MPTRKADLVTAYESWKLRPPPTFECDQPDFLTPVGGNDAEDDENEEDNEEDE